MYGKLFASMYDGSLATEGPWEALVTFQQFIILADREGFVDMTPEAISRRTIIPLEIITRGIAELEKPDSQSRDATAEGRRLERISEHRAWGWKIVNYAKYREIRSADERRAYMREYMRRKRDGALAIVPANNEQLDEAKGILAFLNEKTGRNYEPVKANLDLILARLKEGSSSQDLRQVIALKTREWAADEMMKKFLRPATLFNRTKFAQYKGELGNELP